MSVDLNKVLNSKVTKIDTILKPLNSFAKGLGLKIINEGCFTILEKLLIALLSLLSSLALGGQYYLIWENRSKTFFVNTDAICTSFQTLISYSKLYHIAFSLHKFRNLMRIAKECEILQDIELFELNILNKKQLTQEISAVLDNSWLDIKRQIYLYIVSVCGVMGWYYISCLVTNFYYTYVDPQEFDILLPFQASYPFWRDKGFQFPHYFILYMISASPIFINGIGAITFVSLYAVSVLHTLALLKILRRLIENATTANVLPADRVKYILAWSKLYQRIYEYYYEINSLYYVQSAPLFLVSIVIICLLIYQGSFGWGTDVNVVIKICIYLCAASFEVFMFCINGQRLTTESEKLSVALYNTKWYEEDKHFKLITHMMIMRTSHVFIMEVAGFTTMSRVTFLAIIRTSFSFFLMLKEVNNR